MNSSQTFIFQRPIALEPAGPLCGGFFFEGGVAINDWFTAGHWSTLKLYDKINLRQSQPKGHSAMKRFVIERDMPGVGAMEREQFREAAQKSNSVLADLAPDVQWIESYSNQ